MKNKKRILIPSYLLLLPFMLSACTSVYKPSGFLGDYAHLGKGKYFRQEYLKADADFSKYDKVQVDPVELQYFESPHEDYTPEEIRKLGTDLKSDLESKLSKKYKVLGDKEAPDKKTLIIVPALVYVDSPERLLNGLTIWFLGITFSRGSAALEAKLLDGVSGREIGQVAEKRTGGGGILDLKSIFLGGLFRFIQPEGAFKRWGKNFVTMSQKERKGVSK